jgi:hypothetical protein
MFEILVVMKIISIRLRHFKGEAPQQRKKNLHLKPFGNCKGVKKILNQKMKNDAPPNSLVDSNANLNVKTT